MQEFLLIILAYLLGSIPSSVWISKKFFNIDIRNYGSGNAGATNTFRVLGAKWGSFVMAIDVLKGVIATSLWVLIPSRYGEMGLHRTNFMLGLGLAAVIGHIFPIWANFKGGKGVATLLGMALAIQPVVALWCLLVFIIVLFTSKYVSLSSIISGIMFMVLILFVYKEPEPLYRIFAVLVALMIVITHQKNISRLINKTENKVPLFKKKKD